MKLLVFAHTPPPHHGQSYMVQLMLEGFGGDCRKRRGVPGTNRHGVECYHVNVRLSNELEDIGSFRFGKLLLLVGYCLQAIWFRYRYGIENFYYIPAPGKHSAIYRDWVVMFLCRPFFKRLILHWEAAGLAKWLETSVQMPARALTFRLMREVSLSVILSKYTRADAEKLFSRRICVVHNGIPDPCQDFDRAVLPRRRSRRAARAELMSGRSQSDDDTRIFKVLYVAHCTRDKGLFDAIEGVLLANRKLQAEGSAISMKLVVAGTFLTAEEQDEFERLHARPEVRSAVEYLGFIEGARKTETFSLADAFCFPTYYRNESQPVSLIEAMAFGLPIVTTGWRSIPELLPADYPGVVPIRSPQHVAEALLRLVNSDVGEQLRGIFLRQFTAENYIAGLAEAFHRTASTDCVVPNLAVDTAG
jgi:glycosyltransferase involved in cell wall biosynthesis